MLGLSCSGAIPRHKVGGASLNGAPCRADALHRRLNPALRCPAETSLVIGAAFPALERTNPLADVFGSPCVAIGREDPVRRSAFRPSRRVAKADQVWAALKYPLRSVFLTGASGQRERGHGDQDGSADHMAPSYAA